MRFSSDTKSLSLKVQGYQFPDVPTKQKEIFHYDANWLNILFTLQEENSTFVQVDPFLMTEELHELILWLRTLPNPQDPQIHFTEPSFRLEFLHSFNSLIYLRAHLSLELVPPWAEQHGYHSVEFSVTKEQIQQCIDSLYTQLQQFPVRI
jgi:hypothetical protein